MESYSVDIAPEQIVLWLLQEQRAGRGKLQVAAWRAYETAEVANRELADLGDENSAELSEVLEVGLLEVTPPPGHARWTLRLRFEDDIGPRLPEDEPVPEGEEEIDLETFYDAFVAPPRGTTEVSVEVEGPAAKGQFTKVANAIRADRHKG
jgi:hypothetical protein